MTYLLERTCFSGTFNPGKNSGSGTGSAAIASLNTDAISCPLRASLTAAEYPRGQPPLHSHRSLRFLLDGQTKIPDPFDFWSCLHSPGALPPLRARGQSTRTHSARCRAGLYGVRVQSSLREPAALLQPGLSLPFQRRRPKPCRPRPRPARTFNHECHARYLSGRQGISSGISRAG